MKMGDVVLCQGTFRRTVDYVPKGRNKAYWINCLWNEPRNGIFIGYRTLSNGEIEGPSYDDGAIYRPKEYIKVALVVFNERENPKYVPVDLLNETYQNKENIIKLLDLAEKSINAALDRNCRKISVMKNHVVDASVELTILREAIAPETGELPGPSF